MRVLIFGASGMLGHKLYQRMTAQFKVFCTIRGDFESIERFGLFAKASIVENVDATDLVSIKRAISVVRPDCVINAIGLIKQIPASNEVVTALRVNSIFPNQLADLSEEFSFRLITIGTDCVFDGKKGNYSERDPPDARDLYGLSKLLGEVTRNNALTIRTSIIGRELSTNHSIVEWFLGQRGRRVQGYRKAIYTGLPCGVLADIIANLISDYPDMAGLFHVSSNPISKFELLTLLNQYYSAHVVIDPSDEVAIDRSLDSSNFRAFTGFQPTDWSQMIEEMANDPTQYQTSVS